MKINELINSFMTADNEVEFIHRKVNTSLEPPEVVNVTHMLKLIALERAIYRLLRRTSEELRNTGHYSEEQVIRYLYDKQAVTTEIEDTVKRRLNKITEFYAQAFEDNMTKAIGETLTKKGE